MDISRIEATFRYGKFSSNKFLKIIIYSGFVLSLIGFLLTFGIIIILSILGHINDVILTLVGIIFFDLLLFGVILWAMIRTKKMHNSITLWLKDAVEITAHIKRLDLKNLQYKPFQIQAEFEIDGVKYCKIRHSGNAIIGYHSIFGNYHNKNIKILYSKKYDEVLILKNDNASNSNK